MTPEQPGWDVLVQLDETGELLWCGDEPAPAFWLLDDAVCAWRAVQARAHAAYEQWRREGGADAYATYRAAQDQADAAQAGLEERAMAARR